MSFANYLNNPGLFLLVLMLVGGGSFIPARAVEIEPQDAVILAEKVYITQSKFYPGVDAVSGYPNSIYYEKHFGTYYIRGTLTVKSITGGYPTGVTITYGGYCDKYYLE